MAQLASLNAKFTGDSSSFVRAARMAAFETNKLDYQQRQLKRTQDEAANSSDALAKAYDRLRMDTDNAYASMTRFQKAADLAKRVASDQEWSTEQLSAELARLSNYYGVAEAAGYSMNEQVRAGRFHTANLAAQFNDIGVMLAAGQSPFMLAIQQGTQISQVLNDLGGNTRTVFGALGSAFKSLISPVSLLTIGVIAGGAALVQWATAAMGSTQAAIEYDKALSDLNSKTDAYTSSIELATAPLAELISQYGLMAFTVREAASSLAELQRFQAESALLDNISNIQQGLSGLVDQLYVLDSAVVQSAQGDAIKARELRQLAKEFGTTEEQARRIVAALNALSSAQGPMAQAEAARRLGDEMARVRDETGRIPPQLREIIEAALQASINASKLANATREGEAAMTALTQAAPGGGWLDAAIGGASTLAAKLWEAAKARYAAEGTTDILPNNMNTGNSDWTKTSLGFTKRGEELLPGDEVFGAGGGKGGGGGRSKQEQMAEKFATELEQLQTALKTQEQIEMESYQRRQEVLNQALQQRLITQEQYAAMMEQVEATHQFAMQKATNDGVRQTLGHLGTLFQGSKRIGAAIALANSWIAFTEVLKDPAYIGRPWARIAAAGAALASGLNAVRNIKSANPGAAGGSAGGGAGGGSIASAGGGAAGGGSAAAPAQQAVTTFQFTLTNDPFGFGESFARQFIDQLNQTQRNGGQIRGIIA